MIAANKKVVLITGASSGMGKETAELLLQTGFIVYGAARRIDKMKDIRELGAKILAMDVTDETSMINGIDTIIKNEGRIDILINNAGFGCYGAVEDVPIADAKYEMEVNLFGLARLTQLVLPHMRKQEYGKIVNISSIAGKVATPLGGWYHASKFALEGLSDSLRIEVKQFGIDVILIEPGGVKTEWSDIAYDNLLKNSGNSAYKSLIAKAGSFFQHTNVRGAEPVVIAKLIKKAITAKSPKTRYHGGYMAGPVLFMRKWISDGIFDRLMLSQLK